MKRPSLQRLALVSAIIVLAACEAEPPPRVQKRPGGFRPPPSVVVEEEETERRPVEREPETRPEPVHRETEPPVSVDPAPTAPVKAGNYEYGKPVPGKPGFVTSPYAPYSGYVDVRGFPPSTEVKDPYTGKIFLVP